LIHPFSEKRTVTHEEQRGEFWKPCPGTSDDYICCDYQVLTPVAGCGMYCRYCILQAYFENQGQVIFTNYDDLEHEITEKMADKKAVIRIGTGEFADSLFLDNKINISNRIAKTLEPYPNIIVEFKTKSKNIGNLKNIKEKYKVIIGFSLNTPAMIELHEKGTSSLKERLESARKCEEMGFWVAFHFDPMFHYPAWKKEYEQVIDSLFSAIKDPDHIAWISMGGFRSMPSLKKELQKKGEHLPLFSGELVLGEDKKLRYFRSIRVSFYRHMRQWIESYWNNACLYLCMESEEIWRDSGLLPRIPEGLPRYLDSRAERLLGLT